MTEVSLLWPIWLTYALTAALGLVVGSFLNVVIHRLPLGLSVVKPRSQCPSCGKPIPGWHNIPVISYLILRGRCANCRAGISIRYPLIELLTALLFVAARAHTGWGWGLLFRDWPFVSLLVGTTFIDLEHRIIPDKLSLSGLALGLLTARWSDLGLIQAVEGAALGYGFFYALAWIYYKLTGRSGLGGGDIKLLAMLGAFLGPMGVFASILISSVFGSIVGVIWGWVAKRRAEREGGQRDSQERLMTFAIPYGPFLVVGGLYFYLLSDYLWFPFMTPT